MLLDVCRRPRRKAETRTGAAGEGTGRHAGTNGGNAAGLLLGATGLLLGAMNAQDVTPAPAPALPVTAVGVSERRVYGIVDDQVAQMEETLMERLAEMRRQMMEETERMLAQKLATLATAHPTIQKQTKKAEKEKKKEEEVRGFYEVPAGADEIARLRKLNRDLRKESEGKTNTNRKLQEQIANLESEDPVARYVEEIKKVREVNQVLRKRCEAKDRTYQKMRAQIIALGGKAPDQEE